MRDIRPERLSEALRGQVLESLPREGEICPSASDRARLASLQPVLEYHERSDAIQVKVIDVLQAFVGLHARSVVLISEKALALLTTEELQAVVAHEMGHEYFWREYHSAVRQQQHDQLKEIELRCDGIAVITLARLGFDPKRLVSGTGKLLRFNAEIGATADAHSYPSAKERGKFIRAMIEMIQIREAGTSRK